jgi:hypothetical protein
MLFFSVATNTELYHLVSTRGLDEIMFTIRDGAGVTGSRDYEFLLPRG